MVTFVPRFLFEQFSQVAYFYFLVQVCGVLPSPNSRAHKYEICNRRTDRGGAA